VIKIPKSDQQSCKARNEALFRRADQHSERGEFRAAFRLFLIAAKNGDLSSQVNVGYYYDVGQGVSRNVSKAIYWYKRAYRRGEACAATNIGTVWRDRQNPKRALYWFRRAVKLGDEGSNLEIAKLYLRKGEPQRALVYLERITPSSIVSEATFEEAQGLLKLTRRTLLRARKKSKIAQ
jgi:TPR repeat protein